MNTTNRLVKFSINTGLGGHPWPELLAAWQKADELGFYSGWTADHLTNVSAQDPLNTVCYEAWSQQAALAAATKKIRIGALVTGNTYRHPGVLAKIAVTVDHVSGGRLDFGIGAGWSVEDHEPFGIPYPSFKERLERLEESLEVITRIWTQPKSSFHGKYYQTKDAISHPLPLQKPRPPIMIGGAGEKTLRTVARWADMWNATGSPTLVKEKLQVLERHCRELGRDPSQIEKTVLISCIIADDPARKEAILNRRRASYSPARGQTGGKYVLMSEDEATNAILLGTPADIQKQVRAFTDMGVTHFLLTVPYPTNFRALERISKEVMPAFR